MRASYCPVLSCTSIRSSWPGLAGAKTTPRPHLSTFERAAYSAVLCCAVLAFVSFRFGLAAWRSRSEIGRRLSAFGLNRYRKTTLRPFVGSSFFVLRSSFFVLRSFVRSFHSRHLLLPEVSTRLSRALSHCTART